MIIDKKSFLPITSFTSVGHLLHINLKDNLLQHKHQIGSALLKKNPRALAIVNKLKTIDNTYRILMWISLQSVKGVISPTRN